MEITIKELASKAGKASVQKRFAGKTKKEISEMMSRIRNKKILDNKKTIAVDFDNVLYDNKEYGDGTVSGEPIKNAIKIMTALKQSGYNLVIFTTRLNPKFDGDMNWKYNQIANWCEKYKIPFDEITNNKPSAIAYIDNKAITFTNWLDISKYFNINK